MRFYSISLLAGKLEALAAVYDNQEDRLVMSVGVLTQLVLHFYDREKPWGQTLLRWEIQIRTLEPTAIGFKVFIWQPKRLKSLL
jgi:hypothetical protein